MSVNWSLVDALGYYQEDAEISATLTAAEWGSTINFNTEFLKILKSALEYQGFDPKIIMRQLIRNRTAYLAGHTEELKWDMSNGTGEFTSSEKSDPANIFSSRGPLSKDLEFLIMLFLYRNNHISKIIKKSVGGLRPILEMLKEKYEINDEVRASGVTLGAKDITLPRITGVLPAVAVKMFHEKLVKEIIPYNSLPGAVLVTPGLEGTPSTSQEAISHAICCPFLPSLHPKKSTNHIHAAMLYIAIKLDDVVHRKEENFTCLETLLTYYKAGYESAATPETSRQEVFRKIGFLAVGTLAMVTSVISVNNACYNALKSMRSEDPKHGDMMIIAEKGYKDE